MKLPIIISIAMISSACALAPNPEHDGGGGDFGLEGGTDGDDDDGLAGGDGDGGVAGGGGESGGCQGCEPVRGDGGEGGDDEGGDDDGCGDDDGTPVVCEPVDVPLVAGQHYEAGWISVTTTEEGLLVEVDAEQPWSLRHIHVFADAVTPPSSPGSYPVNEPLDYAGTFSVTIPFESLGAGCDETVQVAVHAEVSKPVGEDQCQQETAWAEGTHDFDVGWGGYLEVELCCD